MSSHASGDERSALVKLLTIVGVLATLTFVLWLATKIVVNAPSAFSSLASIAQNVNDYKPATALSLKAEKEIVNSKESFKISWTDMKQTGVYTLAYTCTDGVGLTARDANGKLTALPCDETLSIPATVHSLVVSLISEKVRFTDVPLTLEFSNPAKSISFKDEVRITVANASVATHEETPRTETKDEVTPIAEVPATPSVPAAPKPAPKPVTTSVYPTSNQNGFVDLKVVTLGSGVLTNGIFTYTPTFDTDTRNALRFDIKNIGTKTSDTWSFSINLPDGQKYTSETQAPLKPQEHVEFTIGFGLGDEDNLAKIITTVKTTSDTNSKNNTSQWSVVVND